MCHVPCVMCHVGVDQQGHRLDTKQGQGPASSASCETAHGTCKMHMWQVQPPSVSISKHLDR